MRRSRRTMRAFDERRSNFDEFARGQYLRDEAREEAEQDRGRREEDRLEAEVDRRSRGSWTYIEDAA